MPGMDTSWPEGIELVEPGAVGIEVRCGFCDFATGAAAGDLGAPGFIGVVETTDGTPVRFHPRPGAWNSQAAPTVPFNFFRSVANGLVATCPRGHRYRMNRAQLEIHCAEGALVLPPEPVPLAPVGN